MFTVKKNRKHTNWNYKCKLLDRANVECATNVTVWVCWVTCKTVRRYYSRMHRGSQGVLVVRESLVVGESAVLSAVYVEQWYKYTTVVHGLVAATHLVTRRRSNSALYAMLQVVLYLGERRMMPPVLIVKILKDGPEILHFMFLGFLDQLLSLKDYSSMNQGRSHIARENTNKLHANLWKGTLIRNIK